MVDAAEAVRHVGVEHPLCAPVGHDPDRLQGLTGRTLRPEAEAEGSCKCSHEGKRTWDQPLGAVFGFIQWAIADFLLPARRLDPNKWWLHERQPLPHGFARGPLKSISSQGPQSQLRAFRAAGSERPPTERTGSASSSSERRPELHRSAQPPAADPLRSPRNVRKRGGPHGALERSMSHVTETDAADDQRECAALLSRRRRARKPYVPGPASATKAELVVTTPFRQSTKPVPPGREIWTSKT